MNLRIVRDLIVLAMLACLPPVLAGCGAAHGNPDAAGLRKAPPAADTTAAAPPAMSNPLTASRGGGFGGSGFSHDRAPREKGSGTSGLSYIVPRQSLPAPGEELWVIQKRPGLDSRDDGETPGIGELVMPRGNELVPIPLKHTDVKASVVGHIGSVDVTQQFENPFSSKIEAVYVFPLPHHAAVNEFVMTVGERRIRGIIREREEAKQIYEQAKGQGYVASLLEQDRPNVFTQKVANIEPGKRIDVSVRYFHTLGYTDGWYEWAFPMVVGPRFNPPAFGSEAQARRGTTEGVGAVSRKGRGESGQKTEVAYLKPAERSGHDIALTVSLDALVPIEAVESRTHSVKVERSGPARAQVALDGRDSIPNRDFVLRWKVAGEGVKSGLIVQRGKDGANYFAMTVVPPADLRRLPRSPVEMVFTLDVSGSMSGVPIEQAKSAVRWALRHMRPDDTFQIVKFASGAQALSDRPLAASPANVHRALQYLEDAGAGGGTMMLDGLRKALSAPADESRPRYVVFLTDGYIGNEAEILGALQQMLGGSRVFAMGVGSSPNRYLLEHMAKLGRGAVAYLGARDNAKETMAEYFGAISHPALTDLAIDFGNGAAATEVYPRRLPDLFVGRPVTVVGLMRGEAPASVKVIGKARGETQAIEVVMSDLVQPPSNDRRSAPLQRAVDDSLPAVWARMKIADLGDRLAREPGDEGAAKQVRQVALEYGLMSAFTSFVAVDSLGRTRGEYGTSVVTPMPVPEGVRYQTSVPE